MSRGGKRPGAGAPRGNFNGIGSGNSSARLRMLCAAALAYPDKAALGQAIRDAGFSPPFRRSPQIPALYSFLYHYIFIDREQALATRSINRRPARKPANIDSPNTQAINAIKDPKRIPPAGETIADSEP